MKKAKIILTGIAILAVIGGAFAFKASRSTIGKIHYTTASYSTFGTVYTRANLATFCVSTTAASYWTIEDQGTPVSTSFRTTLPPTTSIVLTQVGGTNTITIPLNTCVLTTLFTTNAF